MIKNLKNNKHITKVLLTFLIALGVYLLIAWASYSPLDNAWSVASSVTQNVLNKSGYIGAFSVDILYSMFGKMAFVVPSTLVLVPTYLLFTGEGLSSRKVALWLLSFMLLMCGLSALSAVLFSNTISYLSGGFIGGLLTSLMENTLGQFGVLLIGMVLSALGFYLCSGQIIITLISRLYEWIVEEKPDSAQTAKEKSNTESKQAVEPESEFNEESENIATENHQQLTDVSMFSRPKISGLKTKTSEPTIPPVSGNLTDISVFRVENTQDLPKVTIENDISQEKVSEITNNPTVTEKQTPAVESLMTFEQPETRVDTNKLPKVSLSATQEGALQSESHFNDDTKIQVAIAEPTIELKQENSAPKFMQKMTGTSPIEEPITESLEDTIEIQAVEIPQKSANVEPEKQKSTPNYPKGYGDTLIHPLLQRKTSVEKPTTPLPTLDLLNPAPPSVQQITEQEIRETSARIEAELANFGVKATVEDVLVGPVVTRYEILPAAGVKAAKITNLDSDLARALIFKAIRITDVVPGKPYMGIETPNRHRETVWLRDVLDSNEFKHSKAILPMALGKDISGTPVVVDMAKMPHLLVAGQTGGGKSVGVNTMILSLLFKLTPEQVRFIMIDPKVVELSIYNDIPHLLTPVVTDMKKAENALRWAVEEMERRYLLVSQLGVRNIEGYNDKIQQAAEMDLPIPNPLWRPGDTMDALPPPLEKMSYIVLIVDEFADLMMSAGKQVEDHIMRIAQKARAVGIHLILATQRPSTDVITGVIKANIPSRIAFTVASQIDSRTILDKGGAESLLGRGDMLYSGAGSPEIIRVHGAFMTDDEVQKVADNWRARGKPDYINSIVESREENGESGDRNSGDLDPLFDEIAQFMIDGGGTSISGIQRRFSLGFNRAARIIDQLEEQGILSAADNRGKREVLAK